MYGYFLSVPLALCHHLPDNKKRNRQHQVDCCRLFAAYLYWNCTLYADPFYFYTLHLTLHPDKTGGDTSNKSLKLTKSKLSTSSIKTSSGAAVRITALIAASGRFSRTRGRLSFNSDRSYILSQKIISGILHHKMAL